MPAPDSLRRLLLRWLLAPLLGVLTLSALVAYVLSVRMATEAYDHALLDPALALAERLRLADERVELDLPAGLVDALRVDSHDRLHFAVRHRDALIGGSRELPAPPVPPQPAAPVFFDARMHGEPVRVVAIAVTTPAGEAIVQVAETLVKRRAMVRQAIIASTVPELLFAFFTVAVVGFGVRRGLAPLEKLRGEIASRSHRDLRAVDESHAPAEVRPLVVELNDLLARLGTARDAQGRFIADAAHQLRTPLAALQAQVEAARRETGAAERDAALARLDEATRRTARLASQLLTLARVEPSGGAATPMERVDLAAVVGARIDEWLPRADLRGIDLGFELAAAPVDGDAALIGELATNLVENALAYTQNGGAVTVRTARSGTVCSLEVEDDGPGIPPPERERVFERFYRVKGSPSGGSGLGLAIVREIAQRHAAAVEIRDGAGARGVCVQVRFPAPSVMPTVGVTPHPTPPVSRL
jgi:two-component system sensor histidine kinase TctE